MQGHSSSRKAAFPIHLSKQLPKKLVPWYLQNARDLPWRQDQVPYHVWLSEIMLQQTRVETVKGYYRRFLSTLPTIEALAAAPDGQLMKLWEGLGYYSRVRNLQRAAQVICREHNGQFPTRYEDILSLPGIGPYTAGAIASICFDLPEPAVDGNVLRVITRLTAEDGDIASPAVKRMVTQALRAIYTSPCGSLTQGLMELGATVCVPNGKPKCGCCPLQTLCTAHQTGRELCYPVKAPKKRQRLEERAVWLLTCDGCYALQKRPETGLLAGMWELPNQLGIFTPQEAVNVAASWDVHPVELLRTEQATHIFTHIKWQMTAYHIQCRHKASAFTWATLDQMQALYALPTAFRLFFPVLMG